MPEDGGDAITCHLGQPRDPAELCSGRAGPDQCQAAQFIERDERSFYLGHPEAVDRRHKVVLVYTVSFPPQPVRQLLPLRVDESYITRRGPAPR